MQDLNVQLIQTVQFWEDKEANFQHFEEQFFEAILPGAVDLIVLPEMFNTGFSMNTTEMAETMQGKSIEWLKHWAERLDCHIGGSLIILDNGNYYNRFVMVSKNGVESFYDKRHLFRMANENDHFSPGEKRVIFNLKGWNILLQVCYDLRFPVFSRNKVINGEKEYDAMIYIANWPQKRAFIWKNLIQARAIENQAYCIGVNRVGKDGNDVEYSGDSMLVDPWGNVQLQMPEGKQESRVVLMQSSVLEDIKEMFPAYLDAD